MDSGAAPPKSNNELRLRVLYSFLMMGGGLFAAISGGIFWAMAAALVMALVAREWSTIAGSPKKYEIPIIGVAALCGIGFVLGPEPVQVTACVALAMILSLASIKGGAVGVIGSALLALAGFSFANLRMAADNMGLLYIFGLFAIVWATDSSAFAFGKIFKGPKLAPLISPNKTWSGFIGGTLAGTAAGALYSVLANLIINPNEIFKTIVSWTIAGFVLSIIAQLGDLLESLAKRYFGVKDASSLIPGHGGILDRLDGHFAVALALEGIVIIPKLAEQLH